MCLHTRRVSAHIKVWFSSINFRLMRITEPGLYHIYNRGNNKLPIFFHDNDYLHFIALCKKQIEPRCQILAWCLMPNHFHFVIEITDKSLERIVWGGNEMPAITNGFQLLQSSYAKRINNRENRTGSLFQQKTKSKLLENKVYALKAFWYLHQNPVKAGLVKNMEEWEYSSYKDYCGLRESPLCDINLGNNIFGLSGIDFENGDRIELSEEFLDWIL